MAEPISSAVKKLLAAAQAAGVEVVQKSEHHWQIKGLLLINYYPNSKERTAYIDKTKEGKSNVSPKEAVAMSQRLPELVSTPKRKPTRKERERLLKRDPHCHWCGIALTLYTSTLDHIMPLSRGGLDNRNNYCLACQPCNQARANHMPELFGETAL